MTIIKNGITLHKAKVISNDLRGKGTACPNTSITPTEIAVHNTGNWDVPSNNYHRSLKNANNDPNGRKASWHFSVDDKEIYQEIDTNKKAWHVGNANGYVIGIEICMFKDKNRQKIAEDNAIALIKELMKIHNIPLSKVKMHKDYTGKYCPQVILDRDGSLVKFKDRIAKWGQTSTASSTPSTGKVPNGDVQRKGKVLVDSLRVRTGRGTNYEIIGSLHKGDIIELYYNLNGWCSMESKFKDAKGNKVTNFVCIEDANKKYIQVL